jgi:RNA polymerase sigma-70 factor, ECF subfamily
MIISCSLRRAHGSLLSKSSTNTKLDNQVAFLFDRNRWRFSVRILGKTGTYLQRKNQNIIIASNEASGQEGSNLSVVTDLAPIVDRLYGSLYQFAVRLTRSESDAADLVQQTFFILIQHLHQIRDFSKIKYWLFTTLRRNFLMEVRHRSKRCEVEFLPDVHGLQTEDPSSTAALDSLNVRTAFRQVDETYRTALELFYVSNLSYREIGAALGIPVGTVMSRLSRGKAQLKAIIGKALSGDN